MEKQTKAPCDLTILLRVALSNTLSVDLMSYLQKMVRRNVFKPDSTAKYCCSLNKAILGSLFKCSLLLVLFVFVHHI